MAPPVTLAQAISSALANNGTPEEVEACKGVENCQAITGPEFDAIAGANLAGALLAKDPADPNRQALDDLMAKSKAGTVKFAASAMERVRSIMLLAAPGSGKSSLGSSSALLLPGSTFPAIRAGILERSSRTTILDPVTLCRALAQRPVGTTASGESLFSIQEAGTLHSGRAYETCPFPVRGGDTIESVAARFTAAGVTADDIREVNGLKGNSIPADRRSLSIPLPPATTEPK